MGFFDGLGTTLATGASQATGTVFDYFKATAQGALVGVGPAPSSNLTPVEIAQGKTATPPQLSIVPSNASAAALANASPMAFIQANKTPLMIACGVLAAYLILRKRR